MKHSLLNTLLHLTRFWNLLIIALTQYAAAWFLIPERIELDIRLFLLTVSTALIAAAGYVINDYYDVKIDLINKPERVVIGRGITRRYALLFHTLLNFAGIGIGYLLDWRIGAVNFFAAFLLWVYSNALKRLPFVGNFTVALLTGMSVIMVNVLYPPLILLVWVYAVFAFFITLVREIIKDIEDLKGDSKFGAKTLPIVWGVRKTKFFIFILLLLFSAFIVVLDEFITPMPMSFFGGFLFAPMVLLMVWLIRADTKVDYYLLSQFCKVLMLAGILSMAFLN